MAKLREGLIDRARSGGRWTAVGSIGTAGLYFLQVAVLARFLTPSDFGQMAVLLVLLTIGTAFSELGLSTAIIQRKELDKNALATLYLANVMAGLFLFLVVWLVAPSISRLMDVGEITTLLRGGAVPFLISPWGLQIKALLQKRLDFRLLTCITLVALSIGTASAIVFAAFGLGVWALLYGYLVTETVSTLILLVVGGRRHYWPGLAWRPRQAKEYFAFGGFRVAALLVNSVTARLDQVIIGGLMGAHLLGIYHVAQRISLEPVRRINPYLARVAFPVFSMVQDDHRRLLNGYLRMIGFLLGVNAPLLLGLAAVAHLAVPLVLGPGWEEVVPVVQVMAVYALLRSLGNASWPMVLAKGRADWNLYWDLSRLVLVPATVWIVIVTSSSLVMIAFALAMLQLTFLVALYFAVLRRLLGSFGGRLLAVIGRPVATTIGMVAVLLLIDRILPQWPDLGRLAVLGLIGIGVYAGSSILVQPVLVDEMSKLLKVPRFGERGRP